VLEAVLCVSTPSAAKHADYRSRALLRHCVHHLKSSNTARTSAAATRASAATAAASSSTVYPQNAHHTRNSYHHTCNCRDRHTGSNRLGGSTAAVRPVQMCPTVGPVRWPTQLHLATRIKKKQSSSRSCTWVQWAVCASQHVRAHLLASAQGVPETLHCVRDAPDARTMPFEQILTSSSFWFCIRS
jgi:hypothetical protein